MADIAVEPARTAESDTGRTARIARQMGLLGVTVFSTASIGLTYTGGLAYSLIAGQFPGAGIFGVVTTAVLVALVFAYLFAALAAFAPRYGAGYVLSSRALPPGLAFASSWTMVLFFGFFAGMLLTHLVQVILPSFARVFAFLTGSEQILAQLAWVTSSNGVATLGTVAVIVVFLLLVLPPTVTRRVLLGGVILAILAWVIIFAQIASTSPLEFTAAWDAQSPYSANSVFEMARAGGMNSDSSTGRTILAGLSAAFLLLYGFFNPSAFIPEVRAPEKNLLRGSLLSLVIAWLVLGLGGLLIYSVIPPGWLSAQSFLSQMAEHKDMATPWIAYYGQVVKPSVFLLTLVAIMWCFAVLSMALSFLYTASREMIAWARDRMISGAVEYMHPALHSPLIAVLLVCLVAEVAVVDASLNGSLLLRYNPLYLMAFVLLLPLLAVTVVPFRKPEWFAGAPAFARIKLGPLPLVSLLGGTALVYLAWLILRSILVDVWGGHALLTILPLAIFFASGIFVYYVRRSYLRSVQQVDTGEQWHNLPAE